MPKKLVKHGKSLALVIDKATLKALNIDESTELELLVEDQVLMIRPVSKKPNVTKKKKKKLTADQIDKLAQKILDKYEPVFRKLSKT